MTIINILLLALHLVAVNVASAGPLVCIWLHRRGARGDEAAWRVGRRLAWLSLACLVFGFLLGLVQLAFARTGGAQSYWDIIGRLPVRDLVFVLVEVAFSATCLAIYAAMWERWLAWPWLHGIVAVLATTNLLYHFPPLMTVLGELSARPELATEPTLTRDVIMGLIVRPEIMALVVHFVVASVAVTGVVLMQLASRDAKLRTETPPVSGKLVAAGAWIALIASLAQLGVGAWLLVELPASARNGLLGGDALTAGMFAGSLILAFGLLHVLAHVALGDSSRSAVHRSMLLMLAVVLLMTATLVRSRQLSATRVVTAAQRRHHLAVGVSPRRAIQHKHLAAQRRHQNDVAAAGLDRQL